MSINNYRPEELTTQRKIISDAKNDTDDLTFHNKDKVSKRGIAYTKVRDIKDDLELEALAENGDRAYLESLEFNHEC